MWYTAEQCRNGIGTAIKKHDNMTHVYAHTETGKQEGLRPTKSVLQLLATTQVGNGTLRLLEKEENEDGLRSQSHVVRQPPFEED